MSAKIPQVQSDDRKFNQYQQNVAKALQLVLSNAVNYGTVLTNIQLESGTNTIPHKLNRRLQGWFFVRQRIPGAISASPVAVQDGQDTNTAPDQTLILYSNATYLVDILVY